VSYRYRQAVCQQHSPPGAARRAPQAAGPGAAGTLLASRGRSTPTTIFGGSEVIYSSNSSFVAEFNDQFSSLVQ
jgi:hypothetical protein